MGKKADNLRDDFLSFLSEAGLIWGPSPEIYGGFSGFYSYGPLGKLLKNKVEGSVRRVFNSFGFREVEEPTVLPDIVWEASGHLDTFKDRTVKCVKCESIFRADKLIEEVEDVSADAFSDKKILDFFKKKKMKCPSCNGEFENKLSTQSLMMKTQVAGDEASLRPETATTTYLPFQRFYNYFRKKLPFGVFQIGKAYRNEISPRQNVLRSREFTQAEGQIFVDPKEKNNWGEFGKIKNEKLPLISAKSKRVKEMSLASAVKSKTLSSQAYAFCLYLAYKQFLDFGIPKERIRIRQHEKDEMAFYAKDAWDIEVNLNSYSWTEMCGIHDRGDYDLKQHAKFSKVDFSVKREDKSSFVPHVIEIAFGIDRPLFAIIDIFYDKKSSDEGKTTFRVPYSIAPIDVAIFPLMKKEGLKKVANEIKGKLEKKYVVEYDESGSIGKRYLRAALKGIPRAITVDYESLEDKCVTIRDRDTEKQVRIKIDDVYKLEW